MGLTAGHVGAIRNGRLEVFGEVVISAVIELERSEMGPHISTMITVLVKSASLGLCKL